MSDKFGFAPRNFDAIKPGGAAVSAPEPSIEKIDRAGDARGFKSRENVEPISRRKSVGPTTPLNIRCPVRVFNPFVKFCEEERLSYWEAIERLMDLAGVDETGKRRK